MAMGAAHIVEAGRATVRAIMTSPIHSVAVKSAITTPPANAIVRNR